MGFEDFPVDGFARDVALGGSFDGLIEGVDLEGSVFANFGQLFAGDEGVGDFAEGVEDGLTVANLCFRCAVAGEDFKAKAVPPAKRDLKILRLSETSRASRKEAWQDPPAGVRLQTEC